MSGEYNAVEVGEKDLDVTQEAMVALYPDPQGLKNLVGLFPLLPGDASREDPAELHVTLTYLGDLSSLNQAGVTQDTLIQLLNALIPCLLPISFNVQGIDIFRNPGENVIYATVSSEQLLAVRRLLVEALQSYGVPVSRADDFVPHITLSYYRGNSFIQPLVISHPFTVYCNHISLCWGNSLTEFQLKDQGKINMSTELQELPHIKTQVPATQVKGLEGLKKSFTTQSVKAFETEGKKWVELIASTDVGDLVSDKIMESAMQRICEDAPGTVFFLNHETKVPEDVFGWVDKCTIVTQNVFDRINRVTVPAKCLKYLVRVAASHPRALLTYKMIKFDEVKPGASITILVTESAPGQDGLNEISGVYYLECSIVGIPMNPTANVTSAKGFTYQNGKPYGGLVLKSPRIVQLPNIVAKGDLFVDVLQEQAGSTIFDLTDRLNEFITQELGNADADSESEIAAAIDEFRDVVLQQVQPALPLQNPMTTSRLDIPDLQLQGMQNSNSNPNAPTPSTVGAQQMQGVKSFLSRRLSQRRKKNKQDEKRLREQVFLNKGPTAGHLKDSGTYLEWLLPPEGSDLTDPNFAQSWGDWGEPHADPPGFGPQPEKWRNPDGTVNQAYMDSFNDPTLPLGFGPEEDLSDLSDEELGGLLEADPNLKKQSGHQRRKEIIQTNINGGLTMPVPQKPAVDSPPLPQPGAQSWVDGKPRRSGLTSLSVPQSAVLSIIREIGSIARHKNIPLSALKKIIGVKAADIPHLKAGEDSLTQSFLDANTDPVVTGGPDSEKTDWDLPGGIDPDDDPARGDQPLTSTGKGHTIRAVNTLKVVTTAKYIRARLLSSNLSTRRSGVQLYKSYLHSLSQSAVLPRRTTVSGGRLYTLQFQSEVGGRFSPKVAKNLLFSAQFLLAGSSKGFTFMQLGKLMKYTTSLAELHGLPKSLLLTSLMQKGNWVPNGNAPLRGPTAADLADPDYQGRGDVEDHSEDDLTPEEWANGRLTAPEMDTEGWADDEMDDMLVKGSKGITSLDIIQEMLTRLFDHHGIGIAGEDTEFLSEPSPRPYTTLQTAKYGRKGFYMGPNIDSPFADPDGGGGVEDEDEYEDGDEDEWEDEYDSGDDEFQDNTAYPDEETRITAINGWSDYSDEARANGWGDPLPPKGRRSRKNHWVALGDDIQYIVGQEANEEVFPGISGSTSSMTSGPDMSYTGPDYTEDFNMVSDEDWPDSYFDRPFHNRTKGKGQSPTEFANAWGDNSPDDADTLDYGVTPLMCPECAANLGTLEDWEDPSDVMMTHMDSVHPLDTPGWPPKSRGKFWRPTMQFGGKGKQKYSDGIITEDAPYGRHIDYPHDILRNPVPGGYYDPWANQDHNRWANAQDGVGENQWDADAIEGTDVSGQEWDDDNNMLVPTSYGRKGRRVGRKGSMPNEDNMDAYGMDSDSDYQDLDNEDMYRSDPWGRRPDHENFYQDAQGRSFGDEGWDPATPLGSKGRRNKQKSIKLKSVWFPLDQGGFGAKCPDCGQIVLDNPVWDEESNDMSYDPNDILWAHASEVHPETTEVEVPSDSGGEDEDAGGRFSPYTPTLDPRAEFEQRALNDSYPRDAQGHVFSDPMWMSQTQPGDDPEDKDDLWRDTSLSPSGEDYSNYHSPMRDDLWEEEQEANKGFTRGIGQRSRRKEMVDGVDLTYTTPWSGGAGFNDNGQWSNSESDYSGPASMYPDDWDFNVEGGGYGDGTPEPGTGQREDEAWGGDEDENEDRGRDPSWDEEDEEENAYAYGSRKRQSKSLVNGIFHQKDIVTLNPQSVLYQKLQTHANNTFADWVAVKSLGKVDIHWLPNPSTRQTLNLLTGVE